jgi:hypothetical protein
MLKYLALNLIRDEDVLSSSSVSQCCRMDSTDTGWPGETCGAGKLR